MPSHPKQLYRDSFHDAFGLDLNTQPPVTQQGAVAYGDAILARKGVPPETEPAPPSDGWTDLPVASDAAIVYVSASGDDFNNGSSETTPVRTIARAQQVARNDMPDRIRLRRGDVFDEGLRWEHSGRSPSEPVVLEAYGSGPRPRITGQIVTFGPERQYDIALVGIECKAGMRLNLGGAHMLIEDCAIIGGSDGIALDFYGGLSNRWQDFKLRRCIIADQAAPAAAGHVQGLYIYGVDGLLVEECVIDNNGAPADIFRHGIYAQTLSTGSVFRRNVISNNSSHGLMARSGGIVEGNLLWRNAIQLLMGGEDPQPGPTPCQVHNNVMLDSKDIDPSLPRGWGITIQNSVDGDVSGNIVARSTGHQIDGLGVNGAALFGVKNTKIHGNVFHKHGPINLNGPPSQLTGTTCTDVATTDDSLYVDPHVQVPSDFLQRMRQGWDGQLFDQVMQSIRAWFARKP